MHGGFRDAEGAKAKAKAGPGPVARPDLHAPHSGVPRATGAGATTTPTRPACGMRDRCEVPDAAVGFPEPQTTHK